MNNRRRDKIKQAITHMEAAMRLMETVSNGETFACDNVPENLQDSEMAQTLERNADALDDIVHQLEDIIQSLKEM